MPGVSKNLTQFTQFCPSEKNIFWNLESLIFQSNQSGILKEINMNNSNIDYRVSSWYLKIYSITTDISK